MPTPTLAIVADDLSSATDCGVQVARWGLSVTVPLQPPATWPGLPAAEVMSVTTESRPVPGAVAFEAAAEAARQLWAIGYRHFFKSMDSTLRGNVLDEVRALVDVARPAVVVAAPAFPTYGRTTEGGVHFLHGRPIHTTEFGSDPLNPVRDSDVPRLLAPLGLPQAHLALADVRLPADALAQRLNSLAAGGCRLVVADACEEADLARLVAAVARSGLAPLWVGSTGLAGHVAGYFRSPPVPAAARLPERAAPGLILAGTASEHTRQQFDVLSRRDDCAIIKVEPRRLVGDEAAAGHEHARCCEAALAALAGGQSAAVGLLSDRNEVADVTRLGAQHGLSPSETAQRLTTRLARLGSDVLTRAPAVTGLVLTGGETASAVCADLGAQAIQIISEVEPGIPLTRLAGPRPVCAVIKAGAFGSPEALLTSLRHLTREAAS